MAEDEKAPDLKDLLAAFDIPEDHASASAQVKMLKGGLDRNADQITSDDDNQSKPSDIKSNSTSSSSGGGSSKQVPPTKLGTDAIDSSNKQLNVNGNGSEASSSSSTKLFQRADNFKEEMDLYQLSTNVLPSYMPAIPPQARFNMNAPPDGFKCLDCGDTFLFEASLIQHLQRRSVYITFDCDTCQKDLIYYNRCSLLSHIRSHREKNEPSDIKKATVSPLPPELMNGFHGFIPPFPLLPASLMQHLQLSQSLPLMVSTAQSIPSLHGIQNAPKLTTVSPKIRHRNNNSVSPRHRNRISDTAKNRYSCSECCQTYDSSNSLEDHFGCSQNLPLGTSQCSKCNMTCASKCSLSAHQRIHLHVQPYACPECGSTMDDWETFMTHVNVDCLHYSRSIGYKCAICQILHNNPIMMREHIIAKHTEAYYKCQACPMAFKASHSFESHKKTAHLTMDVECKTIFKCPLCDIVFQGDIKLNEHLNLHIKEQIQNIKFVYKCMECLELFNNKISLHDHIKDSHSNVFHKKSCRSCEALFDSQDALEEHQKEAHPADEETSQQQHKEANGRCSTNEDNENAKDSTPAPCVCAICGDSFRSLNEYLTHKQTCGSPPILHCCVCNKVSQSKEDLVEDGRKHLDDGIMVCLLCGNNPRYENKKALFKHIELHLASGYPAKCNLCLCTSNESKESLKHLRSEHGFNPVKCDMCDAEFYGSARMNRHKQSVHGTGDNSSSTPACVTFVCPLCQEDTFATQGFLDKHFIIAHNLSLEEIGQLREKQLPQMLQCKIQPPKIKTEPVSSNTDSESKSPQAGSSSCSSDEKDGDDCVRERIKVEDDDCEPPPAKKLASEDAAVDDDEKSECIYTCSRCSFSANERSVFWKHIAEHKTDQSAYQCLECGTCFVVIPSLRKHMFLAHKIRDFDAYIAEASRLMVDNQDAIDLCSRNGNTLDCEECCESFSDETALKNHMRTHGMAFVRSHSTSSGLPEPDVDAVN